MISFRNLFIRSDYILLDAQFFLYNCFIIAYINNKKKSDGLNPN